MYARAERERERERERESSRTHKKTVDVTQHEIAANVSVARLRATTQLRTHE